MAHEEFALTVGEITAPFGIKGEAKVRLDTDFPDRFARMKQVCLRWASGATRIAEIETARVNQGQVVLKLRGIDTRTDAESLRGAMLQIRPDEAVRLPNNEFYIHDLLGCMVVLESGRELGRIKSVLRGPGNDVYAIGEGKDEILLPAVRDVVKSVDIVARTVVVSPTPGLMPDEAEEA